MAMRTQRSKALHNFTLPAELRWGHQRLLHCINLNSTAHTSPLHRGGPSPHLHGSRKPDRTPPPPDGCRRFSDGIAAMREKVISDLRTEADKIKHVIFNDGLRKGETFVSPAEDHEINRPWNLRTRRAAHRTLAVSRFVSGGNASMVVDMVKPSSESSHKGTGLTAPPPRLRSGGIGAAAAASGEKRDRPRFSVALSKNDIEEDFLAMVGHRPARRPRKRAKIVQRNLDTLFPGLWLTEVTPNMYKVSEAAPSQGR